MAVCARWRGRSGRCCWSRGGSFAIIQFVTANFIDYSLTDVLASLGSLAITLGFLKLWRPAPSILNLPSQTPSDETVKVEQTLRPGTVGSPG